MNTANRIVLIASLVLNAVLVVLLLTGNRSPTSDPEPTAQAIAAAPGVTIVVVTATPSATVAEPVATGPTAIPTLTPAAPSPTPTPTLEVAQEPPSTPNPLPSPTPLPEPTVEPTAAPTAMPTAAPSPTPVPGPEWLQYANRFRDQSGVPQLAENVDWSEGARLHSIYMVNTEQLWHSEDPASPWFSQAGHDAAANGNIAASNYGGESPTTWAIDYWISAPFHALPLLDPELYAVGYGWHYEDGPDVKLAATMDIKRGQGPLPINVTFPLLFPRDGGQTWVLKHGLPEFPDPLTSCEGYQRPTGAPIMVQMGPGDGVPVVSEHHLTDGERELEHCIFDESSYVNPASQTTGRLLLNNRDAIVIMPRRPLEVGRTYTVTLVVNGETIRWSFDAVAHP